MQADHDAPDATPLTGPGRRRTLVLVVLIVLGVCAIILALTNLPFWESVIGAGSGAYAAVLALVLGDALIPVLPGETTLNAASVAAEDGRLALGWVALAGAIGAVLGDTCVYWIARSLHGPLHERVMRAAQNPRATPFLAVFKDRAPMMIVFGRYVPGVRLVVNVTMGSVVRLPYPRFLLWSTIAGTAWSVYTCTLAFVVARVLDGNPIVSIVVSGTITTLALIVIARTLRTGVRAERAKEQSPEAASTPEC
jgi:membrane protein DedA with SNARE-associated domain